MATASSSGGGDPCAKKKVVFDDLSKKCSFRHVFFFVSQLEKLAGICDQPLASTEDSSQEGYKKNILYRLHRSVVTLEARHGGDNSGDSNDVSIFSPDFVPNFDHVLPYVVRLEKLAAIESDSDDDTSQGVISIRVLKRLAFTYKSLEQRKRAAESEEEERKVKKAKSDSGPNKPKLARAVAFFLFQIHFAKEYKELPRKAQGVSFMEETVRRWRSMTEEEKKPYAERVAKMEADYEMLIGSKDGGNRLRY